MEWNQVEFSELETSEKAEARYKKIVNGIVKCKEDGELMAGAAKRDSRKNKQAGIKAKLCERGGDSLMKDTYKKPRN